MNRRLIWIPVLLVLLPAFYFANQYLQSQAAPSAEAEAAFARGKSALQDFQRRYPVVETKLDRSRAADPKASVNVIRAEILPLFDDIAARLDEAIRAGEGYLAAARAGKATEGIASNVASWKANREGFLAVRKTYADEAVLHEKGAPVDEKAMVRLVEQRVAAAASMQRATPAAPSTR